MILITLVFTANFSSGLEAETTYINVDKISRLYLRSLTLGNSLQITANFPGLNDQSVCDLEIREFHEITDSKVIRKFLNKIEIYVNGARQHRPHAFTKTGSAIYDIRGKSQLYVGSLTLISKSNLNLNELVYEAIQENPFNNILIKSHLCN